jgi:hypothetical protein
MNPSSKSWATPTIISAFTISAVTGILMFFHKGDGLVKPVHEWLSWALVAGGVTHVAANWKTFKAYFTRKPALAIIAIGAIVTISTVTIPAQEGKGNPAMKINSTLASSSVETLSQVVHLTPEQAVQKLEKSGLKVGAPDQSIKSIAADNGKKENMVLFALFE